MSDDKPLLPSLLDRLSDDSFVLTGISACSAEITILEKHLNSKSVDVSDEQRQKWKSELAKQRSQAEYLRSFIGSFESIRDSVKRDLGWLMNCRSFYMEEKSRFGYNMTPLDEEKYPHVAASVINYGVTDLTGRTSSSIGRNQLEKMMRQALLRFEPRIIPESLDLSVTFEDSMQDHNVLMFDIDAMLWAEPAPVHLQIRTQLDLESGDINIVE